MKYVSTRGTAPQLGFCDVLLAGLARDGGLYVPETWPSFSSDALARLAGRPYDEVAFTVIRPFVGGEIEDALLARLCREAYATFRHPAVAPLVQTGPNAFILELFHGPTLAFKDVAMQLLARLMDHVLTVRGRRATIVGATSGDTGGAAIEAFRGRQATDIFILFPKGRVSPVQQRQMTTAADANVHAIAVEGSFDDCQAIVKSLFNDLKFRDRVALSGVNSINWARIVAQVVYYITAGLALGAPHRAVSFTVPTGNFGDVFAGYVAKRIGLPIERLVIATNSNDILARTLASGRYEMTGVVPTTSPSMDIQISSNFERLLFEAAGRDAGTVRQLMGGLTQSGAFTVPPAALAAIRGEFEAGRADEAATAATMRSLLAETGYLADPHTAVALTVAGRVDPSPTPMVTLSTAHPAKFPAAVEAATGVKPELPAWLGDFMDREEHFSVLPNDTEAVARFVEARARAVEERAGT
ncbi:threonine synthase [Kaistia soli]|uniref:threonine synthase n=1 Tax=Kaistia soli TaxID=446684 RepID=UPI00093408F1|nr:threonine synthase [Kaistia soli]